MRGRFLRFTAAAALIVLTLVACGGDNRGTVLDIPEAPNDGTEHIQPGAPHLQYSTRPATSGPHWSTAPTQAAPLGSPVCWGGYDQPIPDEALVHNLEHGGIGLHYNCPGGCPELVSSLKKLMPASRSQFVLSPYLGMPTKIAVTAWRRLLTLNEFDEAKLKSFINQYKDRAPESVDRNLFSCPVKPG